MFQGIPEEKKDKIWGLVIFILAFALRLVYLLEIKSNPHFSSPTMDPLYHDVWAQNIAGGNWIGTKVFFRAPFYPYFLAIVYKMFGHDYVIPRLIQHAFGSVSCVLAYLLAKRLFSRKVAVVSGLIAASYGMLWYYEGELLLDSFLVFFDLLLMLFLLKTSERPKSWGWLVCGLVLGFSAITRPNILFFVPFVWLWIFLIFRKEKPWEQIVRYCGSFLLGSILIILPVTFRNVLVGRDLVLIASQGGINFYIGNNKNSDGMSAIFYKEDWQYRDFEQMAKKETGRTMKPSEISDFYYRKGIDFLLNNRTQAFKLLVKKLYVFWNRFEISNNQDIYFFRRYSPLIRALPLGFWLIGPLGLVGMILSVLATGRPVKGSFGQLAARRKQALLPTLFVFSYMATVIMFFVTARFRLPVIPFLIVFSGWALVWFAERVFAKDISAVGLFLLLLLPFSIFTNSNAYHLGVGDFSQAYFSLGNVYLNQGKLDPALAEYDSALTYNPRFGRVHLNRGMVFFKKGEYDQAEREFLTELEFNPTEDKAYNDLSAIYRQEGRYDQAERMAEKALQLKGYYPEAYMNLASSYWENGEAGKAKEILHQGLENVKPFYEGELLLGEIYQSEAKTDSAIERFETIVQAPSSAKDVAYDLETLASKGDPLNLGESQIKAKAHFDLATVCAQRGDLDGAEIHLKQALSLNPDLAEANANLGSLYDHTGRGVQAIPLLKKAVSLDTLNAAYHYNLGLAYAKQLRLDWAREEFQISLSLDSSLTEASEKLHLVDSLLQTQNPSP
ncbi:MAG: tetratricopeptide repeat protein [Candidatus Zixiibacteriota bacterium]